MVVLSFTQAYILQYFPYNSTKSTEILITQEILAIKSMAIKKFIRNWFLILRISCIAKFVFRLHSKTKLIIYLHNKFTETNKT